MHSFSQSKLVDPLEQPCLPLQFFNIPAPEPFDFPLATCTLQSVSLIQHHYPVSLNRLIAEGTPPTRMGRTREIVYLAKAKSLLIGTKKMKMEGVCTFAYNGSYLVVFYDNRTLGIFGDEMKLLKEIPNLSEQPIREAWIVTPVGKVDGLVMLTSSGSDLTVRKVQKGFFTSWGQKFKKTLCQSTEPFVAFAQAPSELMSRHLLQKYPTSTLVLCMSPTQICLIEIDSSKTSTEDFAKVLFTKSSQNSSHICSASWGEALVHTSSENHKTTSTIVITYTQGNQLYHLIPATGLASEYSQSQAGWYQTRPLVVDKNVVLAQYLREGELFLVHEDGTVKIISTKQVNWLDKTPNPIIVEYQFPDRPKPKVLGVDKFYLPNYSCTMFYQSSTTEIYYLTPTKIGVYGYCSWGKICDQLKQLANMEGAMKLLASVWKGANKFSMGFTNSQKQKKELTAYVSKIAIEYLHIRLPKYQQMGQAVMNKYDSEDWVKRELVAPVQLLVRTEEYQFLFTTFKDSTQEYISEAMFYKILQPFVLYGMIKFIPEQKLKSVFDFYVTNHQVNVVQRLAMSFDLNQIEKGIVIQYCLQNVLAVSLAFICTQGSQSEFITPLVKFYGMIESIRDNPAKARVFAENALWYIRICIQKRMTLQEYPQQRYGPLLGLLTTYLFNQKIVQTLYSLSPLECLDTLSLYFDIQNTMIVLEYCGIKSPLGVADWIKLNPEREVFSQIVTMVSSCVESCKSKRSIPEDSLKDQQSLCLFLSRIIINKTVKFTKSKYLYILNNLIENHEHILPVGQGCQQVSVQEARVKSQQYINKVLMQSINEVKPDTLDLSEVYTLAETSRLVEVQVYIRYVQGNYGGALDIYLGSEDKLKVYQFILNTFKLLGFEKRAKDRTLLQKQVKSRISALVVLDPERTTDIAKIYFPYLQDELIEALEGEKSLQLKYLQGLIFSQTPMSQKSTLLFVDLMCTIKPTQMFETLRKYPVFPIEETLKICQKHNVNDCLEYLYERMGLSGQSIKVSVSRIQHMIDSNPQASLNLNEIQDTNLSIQEVLSGVTKLCVRNKSEQLWEQLFESIIHMSQKYADKPQLYSFLNKTSCRVFYQLLTNCSVDYCADLLERKFGSIPMSLQMNRVFLNYLRNLLYNQNMIYFVKSVDIGNQFVQEVELYIRKIKGYPVSEMCHNCEQPLDKTKKCISFYCGHSFHKQCAVSCKDNSEYCCVRCLEVEQNPFQIYSSSFSHRKTSASTMTQQAKSLKEKTLLTFKDHELDYRQRQLEKEHEKTQMTKLEKLRSYQGVKIACDQISNHVLDKLERGMRLNQSLRPEL